jgi:hypothetical protein
VPPPFVAAHFEGLDNVDENVDDGRKWYFYRYFNDSCPAWPGLLATTDREKSKLMAIINDAATMMYSSHGPMLTADDVLHLYGRFVIWRKDLPSSIGNIESYNSQALPHVLSLL